MSRIMVSVHAGHLLATLQSTAGQIGIAGQMAGEADYLLVPRQVPVTTLDSRSAPAGG
jgi:hypothetical protein